MVLATTAAWSQGFSPDSPSLTLLQAAELTMERNPRLRSATFGRELPERTAGTIGDIACRFGQFAERNRHVMPPGRGWQPIDFPPILVAWRKVARLGPIDDHVAFRRHERRMAFVDCPHLRHGGAIQGRVSYQ